MVSAGLPIVVATIGIQTATVGICGTTIKKHHEDA
jgi:hypothetical protein